jgi:FlaA1/EpsC-like NDP-sugar epimerase
MCLFEAVQTNAVDLEYVIDAAIGRSAERILFMSSDKGVIPANTMVTTKHLDGQLTTAGNSTAAMQTFDSLRCGREGAEPFTLCRYHLHGQIRSGDLMKLTDTPMIRSFLTYESITLLVDQVIEVMEEKHSSGK